MPPMPPLFNTAVKDVPSTLLKNCLTFYLAKYTVNISALQHYCFVELQLMSLYEVLNLLSRWPFVFRSFLLPPLVAHDVVTPNMAGAESCHVTRGREKQCISYVCLLVTSLPQWNNSAQPVKAKNCPPATKVMGSYLVLSKPRHKAIIFMSNIDTVRKKKKCRYAFILHCSINVRAEFLKLSIKTPMIYLAVNLNICSI